MEYTDTGTRLTTEAQRGLRPHTVKELEERKQRYREESAPTYVYVMSDGNARTKIGTSRDPERRLRAFFTSNPTIALIEALPVCSRKLARYIESSIHRTYYPKRINRRGTGGIEWFNVPPEEAIKTVRRLVASQNYLAKDFRKQYPHHFTQRTHLT